MIRYLVNLIEDYGKILVTFDDVPEAITFGEDRNHALKKPKMPLRVLYLFTVRQKNNFLSRVSPRKISF